LHVLAGCSAPSKEKNKARSQTEILFLVNLPGKPEARAEQKGRTSIFSEMMILRKKHQEMFLLGRRVAGTAIMAIRVALVPL
jgi:hypothetical protein